VTTDARPTTVDRAVLVRLTAAKAVANTALRWIPPFLPTLERAFGATTTQLTTVLGLGEIAGLSTIGVGKHLNRGRERLVMISGLAAISLSALIALGGSLWTFAVSFVLLILGVANFTVAGHTWISGRVDFRWRARSIGLFETSWAIALLVGGPIVAILINVFGWRGPFVAVSVGCALAALLVAVTLPRPEPQPAAGHADSLTTRLTPRAWFVVIGSATMAMSGLSVFIISGSWLDDAFGVSTGGLGAIVMGFGAFELMASSGSAVFADRVGKMRSTLAGLVGVVAGLLIMLSADGRLLVGVVGLLVLLLSFEYGFVTSLSLVSEAMPEARGTTLAVGNAVGTLARGSGTILSGWLYGIHGIAGTAGLSATAAAVSLSCFALSRRAD
jgi:predicted MFS family arabinose efflux permease